MASPIEVAISALLAIATAAVGSYGLTLYIKGDPISKSIEPADVKTFSLTGNQTLESSYKGLFLDITKKDNLSKIVKPIKENQEWWEWAYEYKFLKYKANVKLDKLFQTVELGYSSTSPKALNKVCDSIYKQDKSKFNSEDNKFVSNVGSFCTLTSEFLDISEPQATLYSSIPEGFSSGVLKNESNRSKLVKTKVEESEKDNYNEFWWDWAFKTLYNNKKSATSDSFKNLTNGYSSEDDKGTVKALNNACNSAYKQVYKDLKGSTDKSSPKPALLNDISNFCSIAYSTAGIVYPEPDTPAFVGTNNSFDNTYTDTKFFVREGDNKNKVVDPDNPNNENWWIWTFDQLYPLGNDTLKRTYASPFDKVYYAYSATNTNNYLNQVCKQAYKKKNQDFENSKPKAQEANPKVPLLDLIKMLCTPSSVKEPLTEPAK